MWWVIVGTFVAAECVFFGVMLYGSWLIHRNDVEVDDGLF